jgi:hypothetical protein
MARRATLTLFGVMLALALFGACSETRPNGGPGDDLIDNTNNEETGPPSPNPAVDSGSMDSSPMNYPDSSYAPLLTTCAACDCSSAKGFCFAGGTHFVGPSDAPACVMIDASTVGIGCNPLPAQCGPNPQCDCVINAIQPQFSCYLVCTPDPGYLLVYCPNGP